MHPLGPDAYAAIQPFNRSSAPPLILKSFENPDEVRVMQKGRFEFVHVGGMTTGRATYEPGWNSSEHVAPNVGATRCSVEHVGLVLSGTAAVRSMMGAWSSSEPANCFTFRQCGTIAGSLAMSRMFHCTFSAQSGTPSRTGD